MAILTSPFTQEDSEHAYEEWGANCGPNALAFALGIHINQVRHLIPEFDARRYTNPTMMRKALDTVGQPIKVVRVPPIKPGWSADIEPMFCNLTSLVRIQWEGPWTAPGAKPSWAYRQTHWITTWMNDGTEFVFDVNGGVRNIQSWDTKIVPLLTSQIDRASGSWHPTHIWRLLPK